MRPRAAGGLRRLFQIPAASNGEESGGGDGNVDVAALEDAAGQVGCIGRSGAQPLDRGGLVAKGFEKRERKLGRVKRLLGQGRDGFLNFDCVHRVPALLPLPSRLHQPDP